MLGHIHLANLIFYGHHGVHPEETTLGQRFSLDLTLTLDLAPAAASDDLRDTVDYGAVYALVRDIMENQPHHLIEALAVHLLEAVLDAHPRLTEASLVLRKPAAPVPGALDYVAIETSLRRADRLPRLGQ